MPERRRLEAGLVYATGAFGLGFSSMSNLLVPLRAHQLGASMAMVGLVVGAVAIGPAVLSIPFGMVIDRIGPRRAFVVGSAATSLIAFAYIGVTRPVMLLPLQVLLGMARSVGWIAAQTYVTGLGSPADRPRNTGRFGFATNLGKLAGPVLIGVAADLVGFRASFVVLGAYGLAFAALGLVLPAIDEPTVGRSPMRLFVSVRATGDLLRHPGVQVALMLTSARLWMSTIWNAFYPIVLVGHGASPTMIGAVLSSASAIGMVVALSSGPLTARWGPERLTVWATLVGAVGLALAPSLSVMPEPYLPALLMGVSGGITLPLLLTILTKHAPADQRGLALGLRMTVNQTASVLAPSLVGPVLAAAGAGLAFFGAGLGSGIAALGARLRTNAARRDGPEAPSTDPHPQPHSGRTP